ncbi:hypothetical protein BURMUCGD1_1541 [Burkholderia multivorans CGD1]|nr:hypothetical protein BURMUCGD1_1541 [Burkholderia multivorans CGD1]
MWYVVHRVPCVMRRAPSAVCRVSRAVRHAARRAMQRTRGSARAHA